MNRLLIVLLSEGASMFKFWRAAKLPPLTAHCVKSNELVHADITQVIELAANSKSTSVDKRSVVLSMLIMALAGDFVGKTLSWDKQKGLWEGSREYLRNTNLDVITAEAIVWITFLMAQLWKADREKDPEMYERVGYVTVVGADKLALGMIEDLTGFDFKERATESKRLYFEAMKSRTNLTDAFASVVLQSIGCSTLAEPLKRIDIIRQPQEWTPIAASVYIFFSTMPSGGYETFKRILTTCANLFPNDDYYDD